MQTDQDGREEDAEDVGEELSKGPKSSEEPPAKRYRRRHDLGAERLLVRTPLRSPAPEAESVPDSSE